MYKNLQHNGKWEMRKTDFLLIFIVLYISKGFMIPFELLPTPHQVPWSFFPKAGTLTTPPFTPAEPSAGRVVLGVPGARDTYRPALKLTLAS